MPSFSLCFPFIKAGMCVFVCFCMFGRVCFKVYQGYLRGKHATELYRSVWCGRNIPLDTPASFGTKSTPIPDTLLGSGYAHQNNTSGTGTPYGTLPNPISFNCSTNGAYYCRLKKKDLYVCIRKDRLKLDVQKHKKFVCRYAEEVKRVHK